MIKENKENRWVLWARKLAAIAQSGLHFSDNPYERERYEEVREIAAEILAAGSGEKLDKVVQLIEREKGYTTPKIDVRGFVLREGKILLVQERADMLWTLPGGFADVGDSPSRAVEREIEEESGFTARAVRLLALWDRNIHGHPPGYPFHIYKLVFRCEITGGTAAPSSETAAADFFDLDRLPPLSIGRILPEQIAHLVELCANGNQITEFD